jgi:hypothetical protein
VTLNFTDFLHFMYLSRGSLPSLRLYKRVSPGPWQIYAFRFYNVKVFSTSLKSQAGGPPLIACPRLLIQYNRNYPPYWRRLFLPQPWHALVTGTHLSWDIVLYRAKRLVLINGVNGRLSFVVLSDP